MNRHEISEFNTIRIKWEFPFARTIVESLLSLSLIRKRFPCYLDCGGKCLMLAGWLAALAMRTIIAAPIYMYVCLTTLSPWQSTPTLHLPNLSAFKYVHSSSPAFLQRSRIRGDVLSRPNNSSLIYKFLFHCNIIINWSVLLLVLLLALV